MIEESGARRGSPASRSEVAVEQPETPYAAVDRARAERRRRRRSAASVVMVLLLAVAVVGFAVGHPRWQRWDAEQQQARDAGWVDLADGVQEVTDAVRVGREVLLGSMERTDDAARDALADVLRGSMYVDTTFPTEGSRAEQGAVAHERAAAARAYAEHVRETTAAAVEAVAAAGRDG
jgi:hypothetical protein